jgi:hypothetical protein
LPESSKVDLQAGEEHQQQLAQIGKEISYRPVLSDEPKPWGPSTTPLWSRPTAGGSRTRRDSRGTLTITAIARANFVSDGSDKACGAWKFEDHHCCAPLRAER